MSYLSLYSALITQNDNTIIASLDADVHPNRITGSWVSGSTSGSYTFISSGSFSGASGSITGSMQANIYYIPKPNTSQTGSISISVVDRNTLRLETKKYANTNQLSGGVIQGSCSIDIGIQY